MANERIVTINRRGVFTLEEARQTVSILRNLTEAYVRDVELKMVQLESRTGLQNEQMEEIEADINAKIHAWHGKVRKLGGEPKGLWIVDLDAGDGYYCWKYPEPHLMYWHGYQDGFKNRIPIDEWMKKKHPSPNFKNIVSHEL